MAMALLSAAPPNHLPNITLTQSTAKHCAILKPYFSFRLKKQPLKYQCLASTSTRAISDHEYGVGSDGSPLPAAVDPETKFQDLKWVGGTWDLNQFLKNGKTDWDDVIDAEVERRKWLEDNPQSSSNEDPVVFNTSIIPWWAWMKRFHLPEAELLNGRAAMIGFLMTYVVDSLTGVGLVDQMSNLFCKTLLFVAVAGTLLIRKNEDIETLKKLLEETTFYDKQWQATWQDETSSSSKLN